MHVDYNTTQCNVLKGNPNPNPKPIKKIGPRVAISYIFTFNTKGCIQPLFKNNCEVFMIIELGVICITNETYTKCN